MTASELRGVWGTLLLPLAADGEIDAGRLNDEVAALAASGLHGLYTHGTSAEFHTLADGDYQRINELVAGVCTARGLPFQIGATHPLAPAALSRIAKARSLSPSAIQVILPDWAPLNLSEATTFLQQAATIADPVPLVLYNPPHAKTRVTPEQLGDLVAAVPGLIGVKMAGGDDAWYAAMARHAPGCALFVAGHSLATGLRRGAAGSYSNIAAMSPAGAVRWYDQMLTDPVAAQDVERRIAELFAGHIAPLQAAGIGNPALDKFLAAIGDWADIGLAVRWPYTPAPDEALEPARVAARTLVPELFPTLP